MAVLRAKNVTVAIEGQLDVLAVLGEEVVVLHLNACLHI